MLKKVEFEAKTEQEAKTTAVELLRIQIEKIKLTTIKEKKGLLGIGASLTCEATPNIDLVIEGEAYLKDILESMGIKSKMEIRTIDEGREIHFSVETNENALLIGREGRTLLAIQFMLRNYLHMFVEGHMIISLDIGSYHANRKRQLEILATKTAKEVVQTDIAVKLDPMNAFDRRIVHAKLSDWRDVITESEGEGENRALIIKPRR